MSTVFIELKIDDHILLINHVIATYIYQLKRKYISAYKLVSGLDRYIDGTQFSFEPV